MRKSKGFTLIELLVVIAVIAMLLAILMPTLSRARELGQRAVCANHLKTLMLANELYATKCDGYYAASIAARGDNLDANNTWMGNDLFRECMAMNAYMEKGVDRGAFDLPNELLCPTDKISTKEANRFYYLGTSGGTLTSYGYNYTDWEPRTGTWIPPAKPPGYSGKDPSITLAGWRNDSVHTPAEKLAFIDSIDWWVVWVAANYHTGWDVLGQDTIYNYKHALDEHLGTVNIHGPTIYRHNEGANIAFYDGHVGYMKKQAVYIGSDQINCRPSMWWVKRCPY
jgi:prepilin-type N-terminal cleavage/methylation domain-containing protein/prepilin-type processing-associated H-X9-DG protein